MLRFLFFVLTFVVVGLETITYAQTPVLNKGTRVCIKPHFEVSLKGDYTHQFYIDDYGTEVVTDENGNVVSSAGDEYYYPFLNNGVFNITGDLINGASTDSTGIFKKQFIDDYHVDDDVFQDLSQRVNNGIVNNINIENSITTVEELDQFYEKVGLVNFVGTATQYVKGDVYIPRARVSNNQGLQIDDTLNVEYILHLDAAAIHLNDAQLEMGDYENGNSNRKHLVGIIENESNSQAITGTEKSEIIASRFIACNETECELDTFGGIGFSIKPSVTFDSRQMKVKRLFAAQTNAGDAGGTQRSYRLEIENPDNATIDSIALLFYENERNGLPKEELGGWFSNRDGALWRNTWHTALDISDEENGYIVSVEDVPLANNSCENCNLFTVSSLDCSNPPVPDLGDDIQYFCTGGDIELRPQDALLGYEFAWEKIGDQSLANYAQDSLLVNTSGKYVIMATAPNGCSGTDTVEINIANFPTADFELSDENLCLGETLTLTNTSLDASTNDPVSLPLLYAWDFGVTRASTDTSSLTSPDFLYGKTGIYEINLETNNQFMCGDTQKDTVRIYPNPDIDFSVRGSYCVGSEVAFRLENNTESQIEGLDIVIPVGLNYDWTVTERATGDVLLATANKDTSFTFERIGWYDVVVNATTTGANCTHSITKSILIKDIPVVTFTTGSLCRGAEVDLEVHSLTAFEENELDLSWDFEGIKSTGMNPSWLPTVATDYEVTLTAVKRACSFDTSITLTVNELPVPNFSVQGNHCFDRAIDLVNQTDHIDQTTFDWSLGNDETSTEVHPVTLYPQADVNLREKTYPISMVATNAHSCVANVSKTITLYNPPVADFKLSSTSVCQGSPLVVSATTSFLSGDEWKWEVSNGQTFFNQSNITLNLEEVGDYTITLSSWSKNSCDTTTITKDVAVVANPTILFSSEDQYVCGDNHRIVANHDPSLQYSWSTGETDSAIVVTTTGDYHVRVTNANGCAVSERVNVNLSTNGSRIFNEVPINKCEGASLHARVPNADYQWFKDGNALTDTDKILAVTQNGDYTVLSQIPGACQITQNWTVNLFDTPNLSHLATEYEQCKAVGNITLDAQNTGGVYRWEGTNTNSTDQQVTFDETEVVKLSVSNGGICTATKQIKINLYEDPQVDLGLDVTICEGDVSTLSSPLLNHHTYAWSTGEQTNTLLATEEGTYELTVTNQHTCYATDEVNVKVNDVPVVNAGLDQEACAGETVTLSADLTGVNYAWYNGLLSAGVLVQSTQQNYQVGASGTYTVEVTDINGCKGSDEVDVVIHDPMRIDLGADRFLCSEDPLALRSPYDDTYTHLWGSSIEGLTSDQNIFEVTSSGMYWVRSSNDIGCYASDTVEIFYTSNLLAANFLVASDISQNEFIEFVPVSDGSELSFVWTFGDGAVSTQKTPTYLYPDTGNYEVTLTISDGYCTDQELKNISVKQQRFVFDEVIAPDEEVINKTTILMIEEAFIYPNPSDGMLRVEIALSKESEVNVSILTAKGNLVEQRSDELKHSIWTYDFEELPVGVYYIKIATQNEVKVLKWIKI